MSSCFPGLFGGDRGGCCCDVFSWRMSLVSSLRCCPSSVKSMGIGDDDGNDDDDVVVVVVHPRHGGGGGSSFFSVAVSAAAVTREEYLVASTG